LSCQTWLWQGATEVAVALVVGSALSCSPVIGANRSE